MAHALCVQPLGQQLKHGGELAEQQDAVPTLHGTGDQLDAGIQLGAAACPVVGNEPGVAADLPQAHEDGEHRHLVLGLGSPQLLPGIHHGGKIELALLLLQLDAVDILCFGGQLLQHLGLHPAQDERPGELVQPPHRRRVIFLRDGLFKPAAEALVGRQVARHQEGEDAPQLAQAVLHGGAGQCKADTAVHPAHRLVFLGGVVLDGLGLVQDAGVEFLALVEGLVAAEQVVAGHHHVGPVPLLGQLGPVGGIPVHHNTVQLRCELPAFLGPVQHQRGRADDEAGQGVPALLPEGQQIAEHLHRLAQTHIIRKDAAHAVAIQRAEPAVAVPLVFSQNFL